jgi:uncharacterized membrane protein
MNTPQVLLVGESWVSTGMHVKGFNDFSTAFYEVGHEALTAALSEEFDVAYMPSHEAATAFPGDPAALARYAAVLFSDIEADTLLLHPDTFLRMRPTPNRPAGATITNNRHSMFSFGSSCRSIPCPAPKTLWRS